MDRIEINVITGERKVVELTAEEIAQAQANYAEWLAAQPTKEEQIAKLQEQIDALKMLGIDPINFLVVPRFLASILGSMMLVLIANMTCLLSAILVSQAYLGYTVGMFLSSMHRFVHFQDLIFAIIKGGFFFFQESLLLNRYFFTMVCYP
jgi:hypothetical protein